MLFVISTVLLIGLSSILLKKGRPVRRTTPVYPAGPPRHWLLGNLYDIPIQVDWEKLKVWKRDFGELIYMTALGRTVLLVNSATATKELLDKRGKNYSHRPQTIMAGELIGLSKSMALYEYNEKYRELRKLTQKAFARHSLAKYENVLMDVVRLFLQGLYESPADFRSHTRVAAGRVILGTTYGLPVDLADKEYLADAERMLETVMKATFPGAYLVDFIPLLKYVPLWFPGTSFKRDAKYASKLVHDHVTRPFEYVLQNVAEGNHTPSFVSDLLSNIENEDVRKLWSSEEDWSDAVKWTAGSMYSAGIDTTFSTILVFFLCMTLYPDVQRQAKNEIDTVISDTGLLTLADISGLLYLSAIIEEVKRWHTVVPMTMPRVSQQDDCYDDQFIPAGTLLIPNIWSISQDVDNPHSFNPDRHLGAARVQRPSEYIFGFGRRICPGRFLADDFILLVTANILAYFDITPPLGHPTASVHNVHFSRGLTSHPEHFECCIIPRDANSRDVKSMMAE